MSVAVLDEKGIQDLAKAIVLETVKQYEIDRERLEKPMHMSEVAEYLGVSEATIRRELEADLPIPFGLVRGGKRFYKSEVDDWVKMGGRLRGNR